MKRLLLWLAMAAALGFTSGASAYCRATTCDPADPKQSCTRDPETKCLTTGQPLRWTSNCLTVSVQADGATSAGIGYDAAEASVRRAFAAWTNLECEGDSPSIDVVVSGAVACDASEYSKDRHNANIVMFREHEWPYEGAEDALGLTRVRFDLEDDPGALWDADIEINAVTEPLSVGDPRPNHVDLDSLLTHEAGHVLGLGHSLDVQATMASGYETGTATLRTPASDDVAGLCAIYPPARKVTATSCEPRHGFSELCAADQPPDPIEDPDERTAGGCSVARAGQAAGWPVLLVVLLAGAVPPRRRKRG